MVPVVISHFGVQTLVGDVVVDDCLRARLETVCLQSEIITKYFR